MSYHAQNNTQQKSAGILFVIAFHILVIWCFASGLGSNIIKHLPAAVQIKIVEPAPIEPPLPVPVEPQLQQAQVEMILPDNIAIAPAVESTNPIIIRTDTLGVTTTTKPKILRASKPAYPSASIRLGEEGATGMRLYITEDGHVADVELTSSSGSPRLDQAAIKHAQQNWRFSPCMNGDAPVACWHETKLVWKIENINR